MLLMSPVLLFGVVIVGLVCVEKGRRQAIFHIALGVAALIDTAIIFIRLRSEGPGNWIQIPVWPSLVTLLIGIAALILALAITKWPQALPWAAAARCSQVARWALVGMFLGYGVAHLMYWLVLDPNGVVQLMYRLVLDPQPYGLPKQLDWGTFANVVTLYGMFYGPLVGTIVGAIAGAIVSPRCPLKKGHCVVCGYKLAGLRERRCPECGTSF